MKVFATLFWFEMKRLRKSMLGWSISLCCLLALYLGMYPLFKSADFDIASLYGRFPDTLQSLFGMVNLDPSKMTGYLSFPMKLMQEFLAIGGFILGVYTAAHDTKEKSADFLYSKPISRVQALSAKTAAFFACGAVLLLVQLAALLVLTTLFSPGEIGFLNLFVSALISALIFWLYGSAGLLAGTLFPKIRGAAAIAICGTFFFHIVFSICKVITGSPNGLAVRIFVPVAMFDRELAAAYGRLDAPFVLLWACEICILLALCLRAACRRDITAE